MTKKTMIELTMYVPKPGAPIAATIDPGSGIVGSGRMRSRFKEDNTCPRICIDYEGNRNHAANIVTWEDKVFHAAGRHIAQYPTIARAWPRGEDLIEVGMFRCEDNWKNPVYGITNPEALDAWKAAK
jgi:hypothetical protein